MRNEGSIVLVEDDPDDRLLIQLAFKKARIPNPLIVLSDGESALQYLRGEGLYERNEDFHPPQLILLDLSMPRVDGFEVLAWLRKQPELKDVPVVILSGSIFSADIRRAYQLGANSFFSKPVDFDGLVASLKKMAAFWLHAREESIAA